jgi:hypothetical protein
MHNEHRANISRTAVCASAALAVVSVACSTPTTETNVWKSPTYAAGPMRNIAVLGAKVNESERRTLEDGFVSALEAHGVHATASYTIFPGQTPTDQAMIRATLQKDGYDGALVARLQGVHEQTMVEPGADWGNGFYGAYWGAGAPAYVETDQFVKFETSLWSPSSGKMVWSAITQTENPTSGHDFVSSLTKSVVPSLAKEGLIPPNAGQPISIAQ